MGFFSARVTGLCLIAGAICALYYAVKWTYGAGVARFSLVPPVLLSALTKTPDFVHYSGEHLSILLTTVALAAATYLARGTGSKSSRLIVCAIGGLCLGSTPFAKLQASPIALAVLVSLAVALLITSPRASINKMVAALLAVPVAILISLCATRTLMDAVISYCIMSLDYIGRLPPVGISYFFLSAEDYTVFLICSLVVILAAGGLLYSRIHFDRISVWASLSSILLSLASFFAIYQAHRPFPHYLLFSVVPVSFCVANVLGLVRYLDLQSGRAMVVRGLFVIFFLIPLGVTTFESPNQFDPRAIVPQHAEVAAISRYAKPGDRMAVWGWSPEYYVQTQTIMSTRDSNIERLLLQTPYREYFRARFLSDLRAHPPLVFVDAVAPGGFLYDNRAAYGIDTFPALAAYVREHYTEREEVAGVRIFVAKDHFDR
jgi:succinate dehydrogenase hydrophobic anchor subunit